MAGRFEEAVYFAGNARFADATLNNGAVIDAMVSSAADIGRGKTRKEHRVIYAQPNTTATAATQAVHVVHGATGTLLSVKAGSIVAAVGAATVTVDVKKNGTTVLSAAITLDNANTAYVAEAGTLSVTALAVGDVLTIVTTATAGGGTIPTGLFVSINLEELPE